MEIRTNKFFTGELPSCPGCPVKKNPVLPAVLPAGTASAGGIAVRYAAYAGYFTNILYYYTGRAGGAGGFTGKMRVPFPLKAGRPA
jgi:hypothetical protein